MKTIKKVTVYVLLSFCIFSCGENKKEEETKPQKTETAVAQSLSSVQVIRKSDLELQIIQNANVQNYLPITGRVIPKNTTQLVAEVQGRIVRGSKDFKEGTSFTKGQTILRIDSGEFALNLEAEKSRFLNVLTSMMPDLKADYPDNYNNWLAYVTAYTTGEKLPELPKTKSASEKYFLTSRQVFSMFYNIKAQEERLDKFTLRAPYSGSVSVTLVDNGGLVSPGQPLGTFISDKNYEIESAVSLELAASLKIGQKIAFRSKGLDKTFTATVIRINNIVDTNTQNIPVFLQVKDASLRSGMYLEGEVPSNTFENAVNIPNSAINRDNTVYVLEKDVIKKQTVDILNAGTTNSTVNGLKNDMQLVLTQFQNPISGLKITE
ncbi:MAG: HlyD family efflux transporter periplasmic adaptor subunit [Bacteroidota bacterium]